MMLAFAVVAALTSLAAGETDTRPYEFRLVDRRTDFVPPLVEFEKNEKWRIETKNAEASFDVTAKRRLFGAGSGELNYRATGPDAGVRISPPSPVRLPDNGFDTVSAWVRGPRWTHGANSQTTNPAPVLVSVFRTKDDRRIEIPMQPVRWMDWHWVVHRLTAAERRDLAGASFDGFAVYGFVEQTFSAIHFDNFAVWRDEMKPLSFEKRPRRNIKPLAGADQGLNTGIGRLKFPTRETTILPPSPKGRGADFRYAANTNGPAFFVRCPDGSEADVFADGGVLLMEDAHGEPVSPAKAMEIERGLSDDGEFVRWRYTAPDGTVAVVRWTFRRWGNSLVIDAFGEEGRVCEVSPGDVGGVKVAQAFTVPYLVMGPDTAPLKDSKRAPVTVFGGGARPFFRHCSADWYRTNASRIEGEHGPSGRARLRMVYRKRSDGTRVALSERFFVNVSDEFEDVLPSIPNPVSPLKHVTGSRLWRAHGSSDRARDAHFWRSMHRYGIRQVVVNDHETAWRDGGESYTMRTEFAPGRGGDEGQLKFTRLMREELGYVYGPYNNFWDAAPVNSRFSIDDVTRLSDGSMLESWMRTYAPKIANARAWTEKLVPEVQRKMGGLFNTSYCDCHTAGSPWARTDYDARVPGAATLSASFFATAEMLMAQKRHWNGPVFSEGAMRMFYAGIIDGNYADDRGYNFNDWPWIVDFDLRELHPRECDFGMGTLSMFRRSPVVMEQRHYLAHFKSDRDREELVDRFLAATLAFGHMGLLLADFCFDPPRVFGEAYGMENPRRFDFAGGMPIAWRSYFMTQAVAARYSMANAEEIRYADADGSLQTSTKAILSGAIRRQQVAVKYTGGIFVAANGNASERMRANFGGIDINLPPRSWRAWTADGEVLSESSDTGASRSDYCHSPDYIYIDGRGKRAAWPKARGVGPAVCRTDGEGWEIIILGGGDCEFKIPGAKALALDFDGKEIGEAKSRLDADGWYSVVPVKGAFSYRVSRREAAAPVTVRERTLTLPTYPFGDPDPVPPIAEKRYPYFRFDGSSQASLSHPWKTVELSNGRISLDVMPEAGGKVWGATDLATGFDFIYRNHSAKFRNIAMRGPWWSGGIEFNFGIIGHGPFTSTPVDYCVRTNADGSASVFVSMTEAICRTVWQVEVRLGRGSDFFETRTRWYNASLLPVPYYQWMNSAQKLTADSCFEFPGSNEIGHQGDAHPWPIDANGRNLSSYAANAFGGNKSYHVINGDARIFGLWYPSLKLGFMHENAVGEKYGRKLWLWTQSREGAIWEDLLTDCDGQYAELQSGRAFNQPRFNTVKTPFKHPTFSPGRTDSFTEKWGVVRDRSAYAVKTPEAAPRPTLAPADFNWSSAYGRFLRGQQALREREDALGEKELRAALELDAHFVPALAELALLSVRRGDYSAAIAYADRALAVDTYDAAANYAAGFASFAGGDSATARERLGLAAYSAEYRNAARSLMARISLREGEYFSSAEMAERVLGADAGNRDALLAQVVALRKAGRRERALEAAEAALEIWPLFHAVRREAELLRGGSGLEWRNGVGGEFPEESFLEIGDWYAESGLEEDARDCWMAAGASPVAKLRLGEYAAAQALPMPRLFPYRREDVACLDRALSANASWKFKYYRAVLAASFQDDRLADELLASCGNEPHDAAFYLFRARRGKAESRLADLKRAEELGGGWRVYRDMAAFYAERGDWANSALAAEKGLKRSPKCNALEIAYARALNGCGRWRDTVKLLEGVDILPSEFGDNACDLWQEAWRKLGDEKMAATYPESLGKGAPYKR